MNRAERTTTVGARVTPDYRQKLYSHIERTEGGHRGAATAILMRFFEAYIKHGNRVWDKLRELDEDYAPPRSA